MTDFRSYHLSASSVLLNRSFIVSVFLLAGERVLFSPLRHFLNQSQNYTIKYADGLKE